MTMDAMLVESAASNSYGSVTGPRNVAPYHRHDPYAYDHSNPNPCGTQHYSNPGLLSQVEWVEDDTSMFTDSDDGEDNQSYQWNPTGSASGRACLHLATTATTALPTTTTTTTTTTETQFMEWPDVGQPMDDSEHSVCYDVGGHDDPAEDDVPESMVASSSSASVWSRADSVGHLSAASTSVDSLGLHLASGSLGVADSATTSSTDDSDNAASSAVYAYDKAESTTTTTTTFLSDSKGIQHELSELDITQLPPLSGTLVNWKSPSAYYSTLDEDMIASLLGQKRSRDTELEELVGKCKRRRKLKSLKAGMILLDR